MDRELARNASGYYDETAYKALTNIQKEERMNNKMIIDVKQGDIVEYETMGGNYRIALVVSADFKNKGKFISIIALQDEEKSDVCVPIVTRQGIMYADCGLISFTVHDKITDLTKSATGAEMERVLSMIAYCLDIKSETAAEPKIVEKVVEVPVKEQSPAAGLEELIQARAEAKIYKDLYEKLLTRIAGGTTC